MERPAPQLIDGRMVAERIHDEVRSGAGALRAKGLEPHLVAVQVGADPATAIYVRRQRDQFERLGIRYSLAELPAEADIATVEQRVDELNRDAGVTGILVLQPLPKHLPVERIEERISPGKDVEGLHPANLGLLALGRPRVAPCTALAAMAAIEATGIPVAGKRVVIIGRSNVVGKPLGLLLIQARATVTTCHTATIDLAGEAKRADILVAAAGRPGLVTRDMVTPGTIVIDVGIHRLPGPPPRTIGDVAYEEVAPISGWITPVPGGVGPITVAMLARNTLACAQAARESR
jgi:methylenetetrahydrofolate dehydrogenase (NADP+)/methenyltetrahydrofolate cyclohydrolase